MSKAFLGLSLFLLKGDSKIFLKLVQGVFLKAPDLYFVVEKLLIIIRVVESFRKHFLGNFVGKRFDAGKILFILAK